MSSNPTIHTEIAESILEHAHSIARLDSHMAAAAYESAYANHVRAIRMLAVPHMDPLPDRELVRSLRNLSGGVPGVHLHMHDGSIQLIVDTASRQHKIMLWNRRQLLANEEEHDSDSR